MKTEMEQQKQSYVIPEVTVVVLATERGYSASLNVQTSPNQMGIDEWNTFMNFERENDQSGNDERIFGTDLWQS